MKNLFFFLTFVSSILLASCGGDNSGKAIEATEATGEAASATAAAATYTVNTEASVIEWVGYKPGQNQHTGTLKLQSGSFGINNGKPESGNFVVDMKTLANTDIPDATDKGKLEGHLKSADFFDVEKFPTATFELTAAEAMTPDEPGTKFKITGNLTLKGISKSISLPADVKVENGTATIETPEFTIDRTQWEIKYGSGLIGTVQDKIIADDVKLKIKLVATAQAQ